MNRFINCALFSFCINRVYSRILNGPLFTNFSNFNFISRFDMTTSKTHKHFSQSSLDYNKSVKNPVAEVKVVPVLQDNFSYILIDPESSNALCVDPAEPQKVLSVAQSYDLKFKLCLCTHKHWDHSGGNVEMKRLVPDLDVVGSSYESTPGVTLPVKDDDTLSFGSLKIRCIKASCHTTGHIMYFVYSPEKPDLQPILFTGDTIFVGGCGRFFEGSGELMLGIMRRVKTLPPNTLIYCGHEYTVKNMKFAYYVDPSQPVVDKLNWSQDVISKGGVTVPSLLSEEVLYNPFMRTKDLMSSLETASEEAAMSKLRQMKDRF
nr:hydroxyacylglutathione hydrolase [Theileria orientalis]